MTDLGMNERAWSLADQCVARAADLRIAVHRLASGARVIDAFRAAFPASELWVYGVDGRFHPAEEARQQPYQVAAANWMAGATFVARTFPDALLVDVGSTTTDIIPIVAGRVVARGRTDSSRLRTGELVYTGSLRTPVCAIVRACPMRSATSERTTGRRCGSRQSGNGRSTTAGPPSSPMRAALILAPPTSQPRIRFAVEVMPSPVGTYTVPWRQSARPP